MPKGGKRNGAGRPAGIHTPIKPVVLSRNGDVLEPDNDPVLMMMQAARAFARLAIKYAPGQPDANEEMYAKYTDMFTNAAAKAAPYLRHRLATVTHVGNEGAIKIEAINVAIGNMTLEDLKLLDRILSPVAAASRVTPAIAGRSSSEAPPASEG